MTQLATVTSNQSFAYIPTGEIFLSDGLGEAHSYVFTDGAYDGASTENLVTYIKVAHVSPPKEILSNIVPPVRSYNPNHFSRFRANKYFALNCGEDIGKGKNPRSAWFYRASDNSRTSGHNSALFSDDSSEQGIVDPVVSRLVELAGYMAEENTELNAKSIVSLIKFLKDHSVKVRPSIAALDNGEVRALWKTADREQVALHFKAAGDVNYVLFFLEDSAMKREYKNTSVGEATSMLSKHNLWRLLGV